MSAERQYLDSSALVKLVIQEVESTALRAHLRAGPPLATCGLAHVEVVRAVRPAGDDAVGRARRLLSETDVMLVDRSLLHAAADLGPARLRSLDALHVAAAISLEDQLAQLITYDRQMTEAAASLGVPVLAPT